jgi:hypothetical protein
MNGRDVLKESLKSTQNLVSMYLGDLSDADLLERPAPGANHIAWQLGHVITGEVMMVAEQLPKSARPDLPPGFAEQHADPMAKQDPPKGYSTKAQYLDLFNRVRKSTLEALSGITDADLDRPTIGKMAAYAPTLGSLFILLSSHTLMHAGQFTVVRRKLGKPVVF